MSLNIVGSYSSNSEGIEMSYTENPYGLGREVLGGWIREAEGVLSEAVVTCSTTFLFLFDS